MRGSERSGIGASGRFTATGCSPIGACVALYQQTGCHTWLLNVLTSIRELSRVTYLMVLLHLLHSMHRYSHAKHKLRHKMHHSRAQIMCTQHSTAQHGTAQCCIAAACFKIELVGHLAAAWRAASAANAACLCSAVCAALR